MTALGSITSTAGQISQQISVAVAKKAKDVAEFQGQAAVSLLESAAQLSEQIAAEPHKGQKIDVSA